MKKKSSNEPVDYQRREAIKYLAKIGGGAAFGGFIGNLIGRAYRTGRDTYNESVVPVLEKGNRAFDKAEKGINDLVSYLTGKEPKKSHEQKQPEKIDRRGFFKSFSKYFHNHPVFTGTTTGATYGGTKSAISGYNSYKTKQKIAKLKEKTSKQEERIKQLEERRRESGLEQEVEEILPITIGIVGATLSLFNLKNNLTLTGFITLQNSSHQNIPSISLFVSILLIIGGLIFWLKKNKN